MPDASFDCQTPGLVDHEYLGIFDENLNTLKDIELVKSDDYHTNKSMENLRNKQHFLEKSVPFSFLEIEFPTVRFCYSTVRV